MCECIIDYPATPTKSVASPKDQGINPAGVAPNLQVSLLLSAHSVGVVVLGLFPWGVLIRLCEDCEINGKTNKKRNPHQQDPLSLIMLDQPVIALLRLHVAPNNCRR